MSDAAPAAQTAPEQSGPAQLREALERANSAIAERDSRIESLEQTVRASSFDQAGVPADKWGAAFRSTYDGEMTAEAIIAKVQEWGVVTAPSGAPAQPEADQPVVDSVEAQTLAQTQALRAEPPTPPNANALQEALDTLMASGEFNAADIDRIYNDHGKLEILE